MLMYIMYTAQKVAQRPRQFSNKLIQESQIKVSGKLVMAFETGTIKINLNNQTFSIIP